jgi:hypothetical protein
LAWNASGENEFGTCLDPNLAGVGFFSSIVGLRRSWECASITAGRTLEEARRGAAEALRFHIAGMIEDGEKLPNPSTTDDVAGDPALKGAVAFLVPAHSERTVRINITAPERQIEKIDRLARSAGLTRSAFLVRSAIRSRPAHEKQYKRKKTLAQSAKKKQN